MVERQVNGNQGEKHHNIGNVLFLKLGGGFTGIGFIICFPTYIYSTTFLSMYQILDHWKRTQKGKKEEEERKGRRRRIDSCNVGRHGPSISP